MPAIKLKTPAKINLILSILKKRLDNYHELETIYQTVSLFDVITVEYRETSDFNIKIKTNSHTMPTDSSNLVYIAAQKFLDSIHKKADIKINIIKNIPVAAGMGGGSSDAACVLMALNKINFYPLRDEIITRIAHSIGADVTFFFKGGTAIGKGVGDIIEPINSPVMDLVVIKPKHLTITSRWAYEKYDELTIKPTPRRLFDTIEAIDNQDKEGIAHNLFNSLEYAVIRDYPELKNYKENLIKLGCYNALLSGSGPCIFGIARDEIHANEIKDKLNSDELDIWVVKTLQKEATIS